MRYLALMVHGNRPLPAALNVFRSQFMETSSFTSFSSTSLVGQTLVGQSGRRYLRTQRLKFDTTKYQRSVYLAT